MKRTTKSNAIGEALKAAQYGNGMIQADVARKMGVKQATVSRWYKNVDLMTVGQFRLLCTILHLDAAEIIKLRNGG
ncbi:MAG: helix-turn-helix transcriptional regulator [Ruminococcus sp.]|nr:helix-turn-helix transcriptional regulator [Ruminococcus sp.]MBR6103352.1 helix-turn-helix transcriptional regulator [Ruminococcus sp.]